MSSEGWVFDIQRFSLDDGPGIRTTVFLKGCPLRCQWCHNPEGLERRPQVRLTVNLCAHCGRCVTACDHGGHVVSADTHELFLEDCVRCGKCVDACLTGALEKIGKKMTVEDVMAIVRRDIPFYEQSGGGLTLSGGEPMSQYDFTKEIYEVAKAEGMNTAIETSALCPWEQLEELRPLLDLYQVDLKHTDNERHKELTGVPNDKILANITRMIEAGWPLIIRVPWIPTKNAEQGLLDGLEAFLTQFPNPPPVELMLYHRLGNSKWLAQGGEPTMADDIPAATKEDVAPWIERLTAKGISVKSNG
ncbi:MAG: glycyl-radical enzyme activating protein [bacterium]